jgi:hypothetical protein
MFCLYLVGYAIFHQLIVDFLSLIAQLTASAHFYLTRRERKYSYNISVWYIRLWSFLLMGCVTRFSLKFLFLMVTSSFVFEVFAHFYLCLSKVSEGNF